MAQVGIGLIVPFAVDRVAIEHLAGVEDLQVAMATYHAACERWPNAPITLRQGMRVRLHTQANFLGRQTLTEERKFCWSKLSKWDNQVEKEWVQWIELVAGLSAMIVLTWSLLAAWDGK